MSAMIFQESQELRMLRESIRKFMKSKEVLGWIEEAERTHAFIPAFMKAVGEMGFLGMNVSDEYGGAGLSCPTSVEAFEEFAYANVAFSLGVLVQNSLICFPIEKFGNEEQKKKFLPRLVSGELIGCFANTEPGAGADAKNIRLTAVKKDGVWKLNGTKQFCTNGSVAGVGIVSARTSPRGKGHPGMTTFLVELGPNVHGFSFVLEKKAAQPGSALAQLHFDDFLARYEDILGQLDEGWRVVDTTFRHSRTWIAMQAAGLARRAFDEAVAYTQARNTFGKPILENQEIGFQLARLMTEITMSHMLAMLAAEQEMSGNPDYAATSSMAKYFAAETAVKAARLCYQYYGGMSISEECISSRLARDAPVIAVYEGPSEIQLAILAKHLLGTGDIAEKEAREMEEAVAILSRGERLKDPVILGLILSIKAAHSEFRMTLQNHRALLVGNQHVCFELVRIWVAFVALRELMRTTALLVHENDADFLLATAMVGSCVKGIERSLAAFRLWFEDGEFGGELQFLTTIWNNFRGAAEERGEK